LPILYSIKVNDFTLLHSKQKQYPKASPARAALLLGGARMQLFYNDVDITGRVDISAATYVDRAASAADSLTVRCYENDVRRVRI